MTSEVCRDKCISTIDFCHRFWQIPWEEKSQECQIFMTPDGVFTPNRPMHGQTNATSYFQSTVGLMCLQTRDLVLQWLGDLLIHCTSEEVLLETLREVLEICRQNSLKQQAAKCELLFREVSWCGRTVIAERIKVGPKEARRNCFYACTKAWKRVAATFWTANWIQLPSHNVLKRTTHASLSASIH